MQMLRYAQEHSNLHPYPQQPPIGTMKKLLFVTALLFSAAQINAQQTAPAATNQDPVKTEMRAMSGTLKESLGQVGQQLMAVDKQLAAGTPETTEALQKSRAELTAAQSELESALKLVNTATAEQWPEVKAKAQALNERVATLLTNQKK